MVDHKELIKLILRCNYTAENVPTV
jgi:hypothetical protein